MIPYRIFPNSILVFAGIALACTIWANAARGDETCNSPYTAKLIKGQEDYVYVWALGVEGLGDVPTSW
jgi:methanethiol oxidase